AKPPLRQTEPALDQPKHSPPAPPRAGPEPVPPVVNAPDVNVSWLRPRVWLAGAAIAAVMIVSVVAARVAIVSRHPIQPAPPHSLALRVEKASGGLKLMW